MPTVAPVFAQGVSKRFELPHERRHTLKERALHPFQRPGHEVLQALSDVSFAVAPGEVFGIVGRNGSGKSTLLKCLAGIYRVDAGSIAIEGRLSTFIELGVGFNPDLAAYDNVVTNAVMLGLTPAEARARVDGVIAFAGLERFADLKLKNYSSGMQVRLAFAVMAQVDADVMLIDEVLAVGDAAFQQRCFDEFARMRAQGRTILFVTHDMDAVQRFCDRALLLEGGRTVAIGDPRDIASRYMEINFGRTGEGGARSDDAGARDGDGSARFTEAWASDPAGQRTASVAQGDELAIHARARFAEALNDPLLAVAIVNERRENVFVATSAQHGPTGAFAAGDEAELRVRLRCPLAPGRYHVSALLARDTGGMRIADRWEFIFSFVVTATAAAGGIVDLPHELEVVRG